ncbi:hypothetical protein QVD17_39688 [Tagetes erecta]|uniref:serine C-palmitoyltransferase n=1 Tax=Tagetes erecta TaxID=13708 RepID=A0AAD8JST6_TARER|nr:hypothetical protein QVD17_39688 [Tagetes erecta]
MDHLRIVSVEMRLLNTSRTSGPPPPRQSETREAQQQHLFSRLLFLHRYRITTTPLSRRTNNPFHGIIFISGVRRWYSSRQDLRRWYNSRQDLRRWYNSPLVQFASSFSGGTIRRWSLRRADLCCTSQAQSTKEIDDLCDEWVPESLIPPVIEEMKREVPVLAAGPHKIINGKNVVNFASANYLGLMGHVKLPDSCTSSLEKYGVGSCGPHQFYRTIDVHLDCETNIAEFLGTPDSILYSYGLSTMFSAIPALVNRC